MASSKSHLELCDMLNHCDDIAFRVTTSYMKRHNFPYLNDRIFYELSTDFGAVRPLREVWINLFDIDSFDFVEFYEGVYRFRRIPHYENIFLTVFLSFASSLVANMVFDDFKQWRQNNDNDSILRRFTESTLSLLEYLIQALAIREAYYLGRIQVEKFNEIRAWLKNKLFRHKKGVEKVEVEKEFKDIWHKFTEKHDISSFNETISEINVLTEIEIEHSKVLDGTELEKTVNHKCYITLKANPLSPGTAFGMVKIIKSVEDSFKLQDGDIGVFIYSSPDYVPGLKKCAGAIGLPGHGCDKPTGHLNIVCRELGIPTVGYDGDELRQGQIVRLNGSNGIIDIVSNIVELRRILSDREPL